MLSVTLGSLYSQCLIKTDSYRLICADEVRYADSISSGTRLYISSRNAYVTSPRSVFNLVEGYGQYFIKVTNNANNQKVAIGRQWINRIDSTSGNKALIYIKDINVTFTTTESYSAVVDSAISCFQRAVSSGLATLSDGDYGDVIVSGSGLVMTVDKPDQGLHNLADGDFSVVADSTALSLTNTRRIELTTKNIDGWISRYLQNNTSLTLRTASTTKTSRIYVDTTGANFQFVNGANNASLRIGDSVAVRFNSSGSVGQVLTVTSVDGDGRLVINPKTGGSGTANCEQTLTKNSHGFRKWTPIYWNGSAWARPTFDSIIPTYIVVDSTSANTFKVANCGNYSSTLTAGIYYYTGTSPGYTLTQPEIKVPLFEVAQSRLILQPLVGFQLASEAEGVSPSVLADTAAAIRADIMGLSDGDKGDVTVTGSGATWTIDNGVINNAKLATNAVDSTKAANLSPNDLAQTGASANDVLTWTGTKYAPRVPTSTATTQIANTNNTTIATTAYADRRGAAGNYLFLYGKTVTFFGDSYTTGFGATTALERWTTQFCQFFGATENNLGVSGTTLEKRSPQDWSGSTPNMVDNITNIPTKTASGGLLVFAYGLNDIGYNGGQYNATNYITDYTTVINAAIAKGWDVKQILLIAPYYISSTGYANYTTQNGTVPDATRHLAFVDATATVAGTFGTLYLDIYRKQALNDVTLLIADGIHANTAGHLYIANEVGSYLFGESFREFRHNDASGFGNSAMVFNYNDYATFAVNRNRVGTFFNTSKAASQISLYGGALDGRIDFFTSPSNNTTPVNSVTITKDGILNTKISTRSNTLFGLGGSLTSIGTDQAIYGGGVQYDGTNWKALGTSSALFTMGLNQGAVPGFSFYVNSGNTIGGNITPTEVIRIGATGSTYIGGGTNATAKLHLSAGTTTASTAPLKFTSGTNLTTPEAGAVEYDGTEFYATNSTASRAIVARVLKGSGALDFPDTASGSSSSLTITVTGAATTDSGVSVQRDNASISGTMYEWVITGANTVTVYFHNFSGSNQNPASGTFRATVTK